MKIIRNEEVINSSIKKYFVMIPLDISRKGNVSTISFKKRNTALVDRFWVFNMSLIETIGLFLT